MIEAENERIVVIKQQDPNLPEYLDFEKLRSEGLKHIGALSGKIWTDHNAHDPGITILEVLVYALIDLGYRTNIPFEDIIAKNSETEEDNFLTPLEILTVNPVTITDYRKLLLEVNGVRNAWLEPALQQEVPLFLNGETLSCQDSSVSFNENQNIRGSISENGILLNGLYNVLIEKSNEVEDDEELKAEVRKIFSQYRNIGEDIVTVTILKPAEIGVCVEIEVLPEFSAETVYINVYNAIKNYIQPSIRYYTLEELLDKGKNIEDVFAGRPYLEESIGFVDTEELENLERRDEIYLSDIYNVILNIEGVRKVKDISVKGEGDAIEFDQSTAWKIRIREEDEKGNASVPVFSSNLTCIDLFGSQGALGVDKQRVQKTFSERKHFKIPAVDLDVSLPTGNFREDLGEYYSIQNDFPVVYGIGEDGLSNDHSLLRKTQALQLKGYLMFYDQMLANFSSQLSNVRSLFSLKPEKDRTAEEKQTYVTQSPSSIPGFDELLRFHDQKESLTEGALLAVPVANNQLWKQTIENICKNPLSSELSISTICDRKSDSVQPLVLQSTGIREIYINQLISAFTDENYNIETYKDRRGYFFTIQFPFPNDVVIVGVKRYIDINQAKKEAKNITFTATLQQNYNLLTSVSDTTQVDQHFFELIYTPFSYVDLAQQLTEDSEEYTTRRKKFLDHLLARFGEEFTDYTVLQYQDKVSNTNFASNEIDHQSRYVSQIAEVSRNRGKAFDYMEPSWNTENVSGFEKRISLLSGIENYNRRNLCNFEVFESFRLVLKDWNGDILFKGNQAYANKEILKEDAKKILKNLRNKDYYNPSIKGLREFDTLNMARIFSEEPNEENIRITKYNYYQKLLNSKGIATVESKSKKMRSEKVALDKREDFVQKINEQTVLKEVYAERPFRLLPLEKENTFIDANAIEYTINRHIRWKWYVNNNKTEETAISDAVFDTSDRAWDHMISNADLGHLLTKHEEATSWRMAINEKVVLKALDAYPTEDRVAIAWGEAKSLGSVPGNYVLEQVQEAYESYCLLLKNTKGKVIAVSNTFIANEDGIDRESLVEESVALFSAADTNPEYQKLPNTFGFQILDNEGVPQLLSYALYESETKALQHLQTIFGRGSVKANYKLLGNKGNPIYNFILKDEYDTFLALPPNHFTTTKSRTTARNVVVKYFEGNTFPIDTKEEPRTYSWTFLNDGEAFFVSENEFVTENEAKSNKELCIVQKANEGKISLFVDNRYTFVVDSEPADYIFVYGIKDTQNKIDPLFMSVTTFKEEEEAKEGYREFSRNIPNLSFINTAKDSYELSSVVAANSNEGNSTIAIAKQYVDGTHKADKNTAEAIVNYIQSVYDKSNSPKNDFIDNQMLENQEGQFEWRFYKKGAALANSVFKSNDEASAKAIQAKICAIAPPINLKLCPDFEIVVCPDKSPNKHHFKIYFEEYITETASNTFELISYIGYGTSEKAEKAFHEQWIDIIALAKDPREYGEGGKININETYKLSTDKSCDSESFIAVIPESIKINLEANVDGSDTEAETGTTIINYYTELADLFPIYKDVNIINEEIVTTYKYKLEIRETLDFSIYNLAPNVVPQGSLIWDSTKSYNTIQEAVLGYNYFYNFVGSANNCRVLNLGDAYTVGLVEVFAESSRNFESKEEAWGETYPEVKDAFGNCSTKGIREFMCAAEDRNNYIPVCDQEYWKFKIVSPEYYVAKHNCSYDSKLLRDQAINDWVTKLEDLDWSKHVQEDIDETNTLSKYSPIHETERGYCFRLYNPDSETETTPNGLEPYGCVAQGEAISPNTCNDPYAFVSSNCYNSYEEALQAFDEFQRIIKSNLYSIEPTSETEYGPYTFEIINKEKELAYHPQVYECLQEAIEAIEATFSMVCDTGMHLLEHILLRPKFTEECNSDCLLPICPDYNCGIAWQENMDPNDPCAEVVLEEGPKELNYIPGTDPYSFWATIVLPSWSKQYRTQAQRTAFENILYKEAPAMLGLHILWLSPKDLCNFEEAYSQWLLWMANSSSSDRETSSNCLLVECISKLRSEKACATSPDAQGDCNCNQDTTTVDAQERGSIFWLKDINQTLGDHYGNNSNTGSATSKNSNIAQIIATRHERYKNQVAVSYQDTGIRKTESYGRAVNFINEEPTITKYRNLVEFYDRYSLQNDNNNREAFVFLLKFSTFHLLDRLVCESDKVISRDNMEKLQEKFNGLLIDKNILIDEWYYEWNHYELGINQINQTVLEQIGQLLISIQEE